MQSPAETIQQNRLDAEDGADPIGGSAPQEGVQPEDKAARTQRKAREDELHDEALEESFPASDPPSAKHIT